MSAELIGLNEPEKAENRGIPVKTTHQLYWLKRTAAEKGLSGAFVKIGRRWFIDPVEFHRLAREHGARRDGVTQ